MFQILGRRADSLRMGLYTNFLDTTGDTAAGGAIAVLISTYCGLFDLFRIR